MWVYHNTTQGFNNLSGLQASFHWVLFVRFQPKCVVVFVIFKKNVECIDRACRKSIEIKILFHMFGLKSILAALSEFYYVQRFFYNALQSFYIVTTMLMNKNVLIFLVFVFSWVLGGVSWYTWRNSPEGDKSQGLTGVTQFILLKAFASLSICDGGDKHCGLNGEDFRSDCGSDTEFSDSRESCCSLNR